MAFEIGIMTFGELTEDLATGAMPGLTDVVDLLRARATAQ
jgi:hypothetical protein